LKRIREAFKRIRPFNHVMRTLNGKKGGEKFEGNSGQSH